jgi:hypothetical protein
MPNNLVCVCVREREWVTVCGIVYRRERQCEVTGWQHPTGRQCGLVVGWVAIGIQIHPWVNKESLSWIIVLPFKIYNSYIKRGIFSSQPRRDR